MMKKNMHKKQIKTSPKANKKLGDYNYYVGSNNRLQITQQPRNFNLTTSR